MYDPHTPATRSRPSGRQRHPVAGSVGKPRCCWTVHTVAVAGRGAVYRATALACVLLLVTLVVLDAARLGVSAVNSQSSRSALRTAAARSAGRVGPGPGQRAGPGALGHGARRSGDGAGGQGTVGGERRTAAVGRSRETGHHPGLLVAGVAGR